MSENQAPLKRNETPAATLLRYLAERPGTVSDLLERTHKDTSLPDVGEPGWRIFTTHTVADFFAAIDALGDLVGHKFLHYDEKSRVITLTLPVVARDEAAVESFCSKCGWAGQATAPDYRHDGCNYSAGPVSDWKLYAAQREAAELREENKRLSALVDDLLLAPNPLDDENMRLRTEVAELRAAIREWVEATDDAEMFELDQTNAYGDDHIDAEDRVEAARRALLALAATEGSES